MKNSKKFLSTVVFRRIELHCQRKSLKRYIKDELEISSNGSDEESSNSFE